MQHQLLYIAHIKPQVPSICSGLCLTTELGLVQPRRWPICDVAVDPCICPLSPLFPSDALAVYASQVRHIITVAEM
jgi:hypothetical protein